MNHQAKNILYGVSALLFLLVFFLLWHDHHLRLNIDKMRMLQAQYAGYIESVKRVLKKNNGAFSDISDSEKTTADIEMYDNDDEFSIDSFMVINRSPSHLKESTESYIKDQQLDTLLQNISPHEWRDYTDQVIHGVHNPEPVLQTNRPTPRYRTTPTWKIKKPKRAPLTNIVFALPIERSQFWLSSFFGPRKKPNGQWGFHYGIDMAAQRGTPIKAVARGVVEEAGYTSGYGNTIVVAHDAVYKTRYAHLDSISVHVGQKVRQGDMLGKVGDTGFTRKTGKDASHLHLELYENGKQVNPLHLFAV